MSEKFEVAIAKALDKALEMMDSGDMRDAGIVVGNVCTLVSSYGEWLNLPAAGKDDGDSVTGDSTVAASL